MGDLSMTASELESIARHLRRAGETELARELQKAMGHAVTPVKDKIRANLKPALPDRYAATLAADLTLRVSSVSGANPHVSVIGSPKVKQRKLRQLDAGTLLHPLWGDREHWYRQEVQRGWFTSPCEAAGPQVRREIEAALDDVSAKAAMRT